MHWLQGSCKDASWFKTQFAVAARAETPRWSFVADASSFGMEAILPSSDLVLEAYWASALPQMLDLVPRLPAPDRETAFKVWPWRMWIGLARKENPDFVTICLLRSMIPLDSLSHVNVARPEH